MKNLYILAITLCLGASASAQNFTYPIGQNLVETVQNENYEGYQIDIHTPAPEAIQYKWVLLSNTFPSAWSYSLCDYGGCAVGIPGSGTMNAISLADAQNGVIGWFKLNITVGQNFGSGKVKIYVYDKNNTTRGDTVSWDLTWNGSTASLEDLASKDVTMYPNPATDQVSFGGLESVSGVIYNGLGQAVLDFETPTVNVSSLESGMYTVLVNTEYGIRTKKLVIK